MKNYSPKETERSEKKGCLVRRKMSGKPKPKRRSFGNKKKKKIVIF